MSEPLSPAQIERLKRMLLAKGSEINEKLTALLNKQGGDNVDLGELVSGGKPGETPIERLRRFMALIDGRLLAVREGRYGRCEGCGDALPYAHLEQVPSIDTCQPCAKKAADRA